MPTDDNEKKNPKITKENLPHDPNDIDGLDAGLVSGIPQQPTWQDMAHKRGAPVSGDNSEWKKKNDAIKPSKPSNER